tara:strand:+ start:9458 stop:12364 length:2907 start_codon:yes stop_codon:yes gene_type:complete
MVELLKGKRQVGRRTIGVNRADMSVASSKQTMANVAMNFSNAAYKAAAENSQRDAKRDALSLTAKELVVQDPVTGKYRNTLKDIIGSAKERRGTVYQDTFEPYVNKRAMNLFEIELKGKSQELSIANRANPQGYEQSMTSYLESAFQNFDGEQQGALSEIGFAIIAQGKAVAIDEANRLAQKEREVLLSDTVSKMSDSILGFVSQASLDFSTENIGNLLTTELPELIEETISNNRKLFKDLGVGQERILNETLLSEQFLASANAEIAKRILGSIDGNVSIARDEVQQAIFQNRPDMFPTGTISVDGNEVDIQEAFASILKTANKTNSRDALLKSVNQSDSLMDALEAEERSLKNRQEVESNDEETRNAYADIETFTGIAEQIEVNLESAQSVQDIASSARDIKDLINEMEVANNTRIGTTNALRLTQDKFNNFRNELHNSLATNITRVMAKSNVSGDGIKLAALVLNNNGEVPEFRAKDFKALPKAVQQLAKNKDIQELSQDARYKISERIGALGIDIDQGVSTGVDYAGQILASFNTGGHGQGWSEKHLDALNNHFLELSANDLKNDKIAPLLQKGYENGDFFLEYNPEVHGESEYYNRVVDAVRKGFVPSSVKNSIKASFLGGRSSTPEKIYNAIQFINRTYSQNQSGGRYHSWNDDGDMKDTMRKYHAVNSITKIYGDDKRTFPEIITFINKADSAETRKLAEQHYPKGSFDGYGGWFQDVSNFNGGDKSGFALLEAVVDHYFQGSPAARHIVGNSVEYYAVGRQAVGGNRPDNVINWLNDLKEEFFVDSSGTVPVISLLDMDSYSGDGDSISYMSLNKILTTDEQRQAFNIFSEYDADEGIYSATKGEWSFFPEKKGRDEIEDLPDIAIPLTDTTVNPLGLLSRDAISRVKGGPKKAILVAHEISDTSMNRTDLSYTGNILYMAYGIDENNTLEPIFIEGPDGNPIHLQYHIKDFLNRLNEPEN